MGAPVEESTREWPFEAEGFSRHTLAGDIIRRKVLVPNFTMMIY
jgi:hypothetical protein